MVEAAGVEPAPPQNANWLMARDFRRNSLEMRCLLGDSLCSGVLPSLGDIVETAESSLGGSVSVRTTSTAGALLCVRRAMTELLACIPECYAVNTAGSGVLVGEDSETIPDEDSIRQLFAAVRLAKQAFKLRRWKRKTKELT